MNKEKYVKPILDILELNDDIILASGPACIDVGGCSSNSPICPTDNGSVCGSDCPTFGCATKG